MSALSALLAAGAAARRAAGRMPLPARALAQGLAGAAVAAVTARTSYTLLTRTLPAPPEEDRGGGRRADDPRAWWRTNFRGRRVTLHEGPALASGLCAAGLLAPGTEPRVRAAAALAAAGAAGFGAYDDLSGSADARGLRGHLGALVRGEVTTGAVKMAGIGATGLAAAALLRRGPLDTLLDGALIAAGANLVNLLDLRPGRAGKACLLAALPALASPAAPLVGPVAGAAAALLRDDLAERSMLGDAGANALGAALGAAAAARAPRPVRVALLGGTVALTLASEVTSFSRVIDRVGPLRRIDRWGRCV
ncbi:UDP-N-acetylmuramyl pentapeptide phosphotransferase/UDP-N-acetylglucosamine-1-phosphate transferase [Nocardiopsis algeriensis]|uniref:UDP-N-acetylmuramyl pentapeptide phosphotransferase/UDP-N-acetylglucosamine-1-phosphate transferase n=2 Tax=Nocardiopsis algeriensis TaxID=1478215 RepID=A0A841ITA3_9ACTN|nr:UDP-N-acetylmuramyl pentapeptide phosphotransferase/UDP-N-acetylglucosamine-1-phosphate transferase [Nocardiopsis algeriensis]